jgi:hypothetical protein
MKLILLLSIFAIAFGQHALIGKPSIEDMKMPVHIPQNAIDAKIKRNTNTLLRKNMEVELNHNNNH